MTPMRFFILKFSFHSVRNHLTTGLLLCPPLPALLPIRHISTFFSYSPAPGSGVLVAHDDVRDKTSSDIAEVVSKPPRTGHTVPMAMRGSPAADTDGPAEGLPTALSAALADFCRHLAAERALSRHTVRAYNGDIQSLLEYAARSGITDPGSLDLMTLRGWLADQHQAGAARATLARRGAAARAFTAYAHRQGWLAVDPGPQLGTPKAHRVLPEVLRGDEMNRVLAESEDRALREAASGDRDDAALAMRDVAVLELLYASAIRVSELCELDTDGLDLDRRTVRVFGKGGKERVVPVGVPAVQAVTRWQERGRPALVAANSGAALFLGARGGRLDPRTARRIVHARLLSVGPHAIRHTAANPLLEGGADP